MSPASTRTPRGGGQRLRALARLRPHTPDQLHRFVRQGLGLDVARLPVDPGSSAPFDYLAHSFFGPMNRRDDGSASHSADCVVWANRGGGKTMLGAVATLLDLLFKPGIQVRILGGSLEQSGKMYEHLTALLERPLLRGGGIGGGILVKPATSRGVLLNNRSRVELLAGSQRSVRGTRVHKLRCDEVEEFDLDVWEAAQMVTRSGRCGDVHVTGAIEALSTMHRPHGLMSRLMQGGVGGKRATPRVFRWNAMDVVARCPESLECAGCVLWDDCGGRAKDATGFIAVSDLIAQWQRTSRRTWDAEMMCRRPSVADSVYPNFEPGRHVRDLAPAGSATWVSGMDFGLRSPHAMLWAVIDQPSTPEERSVYIIDEYIRAELTLEHHLDAIRDRARQHGWPSAGELSWVGVDPAGHQRDRHTGLSDIAVLKRHGYRVRADRSKLTHGIELVRRYLDRGRLTIHPRCERLIRALESYHFDASRPADEQPVKDGPDHACDALRYLLVNLERPSHVAVTRSYLEA